LSRSYKLISNEHGQAMVEAVIVSATLVVLFIAMEIVADSYLNYHKTIVAARYGTWRMARDKDTTAAELKADIAKYFFSDEIDKVTVKKVEGLDSGLVGTSLDFVNDIFTDVDNDPLKAAYRVEYSQEFSLKPMLVNVGLPEEITVSAEHEVDGNPWNGDNTDVHEISSLIQKSLTTLFKAIF